MAMFQSDARVVLKRLADKAYQTSQERDQLLAQLAAAEGLKAKDLAWMLFRPDRAYRDAVVAVLKRVADPETADVVIGECKGKPEAAVRSAAGTLFTLGIPGTEQRLAELAVHGKGETQEIVRRLLLDAPVSGTLAPVLWHLAAAGRVEDRIAFLTRLASAPIDAKALPRWHRLARDPEKAIREKALAVLAQHDPAGSVDLFVEQLPLVDYSTQQVLVDALTARRRGAGGGVRRPDPAAHGRGRGRHPLGRPQDPARDAGPPRRWCGATSSSRKPSPAGPATGRSSRCARFGDDLLEPTIELLVGPRRRRCAPRRCSSPSPSRTRASSRPPSRLLKDPDWWIRITAAETLGRLKDPRAVAPLVEALSDPEARWSAVEALGRIGDLRAVPGLSAAAPGPRPRGADRGHPGAEPLRAPADARLRAQRGAASDPSRAVRARAFEIACEMAARSHTNARRRGRAQAGRPAAKSGAGEPKLNALLVATRNNGASDFHLSVGQPPVLRSPPTSSAPRASPSPQSRPRPWSARS